jgi:4-hydroxybenzoate polyprenyltransferase
MTSSTPRPWSALSGLIRASRVHKVLPLTLLIINGALVAGRRPALFDLALSIALTVVVITLGMQLNVLTDGDVDRQKKPHLAAWLTANPSLLAGALGAETVACLALWIAIAGCCSWSLAIALGVLSVASLLYSYNFLVPARAAALRLKITWWGNALTIMSSYFCLWLAGFLCSGPGAVAPAWSALFAALVLVDYSVFINESAADADEERRHGFRTLPALLGQRRTSAIALALWASGLVALAAAAWCLPDARRGVVATAFGLGAAIQGAACAGSLWLARTRRSWRVLDRLVDVSFWLSRLVPTLLLLVVGQR